MKNLPYYLMIFGLALFAGISDLEVDGFTRLGTNAPNIKFMKIEGMSKSTEGDTTHLIHGLQPEQLLMYEVVVNYSSEQSIKENYSDLEYPGYEFYVWNNGDRLIFDLSGINSERILNKPLTATIVFQEIE